MPTGTDSLSTIGFDADDTLWQNEQFYRLTEKRFTGLLADYAEAEDLTNRLLEAEKKNLKAYGFGIKGFTLSMIETAIEVTEGRVPSTVIHQIVDAGRDLLSHPVEPLPHARATLEQLSGKYRLVLITKGDLFDQERKLAQSGTSIVVVTHHLPDIIPEIGRVVLLKHGRIFKDGSKRDVLTPGSLSELFETPVEVVERDGLFQMW